MNRNSQDLKDKQKQDLTGLVSNLKVDFSRNRKIPYENMILSLLTMEGTTLSNELLRQFGCSTTTATSAAFVQFFDKGILLVICRVSKQLKTGLLITLRKNKREANIEMILTSLFPSLT